MGKQKKPRKNKKQKRDNDDIIALAVNNVLKDIYLINSSVTNELKVHNLNRLSMLLKGRNLVIGNKALSTMLTTVTREWYFWIGFFCDDGDEVWHESSVGIVPECVHGVLIDIMPDLIKQEFDNLDESQHVKGWGYCITPSYRNALEKSSDWLGDLFMKQDVMNPEKQVSTLLKEAA